MKKLAYTVLGFPLYCLMLVSWLLFVATSHAFFGVVKLFCKQHVAAEAFQLGRLKAAWFWSEDLEKDSK